MKLIRIAYKITNFIGWKSMAQKLLLKMMKK